MGCSAGVDKDVNRRAELGLRQPAEDRVCANLEERGVSILKRSLFKVSPQRRV